MFKLYHLSAIEMADKDDAFSGKPEKDGEREGVPVFSDRLY